MSIRKLPKGLVYGWGCNETWELGLGANHVNQFLPIVCEDTVKKKVVAVYSSGHYSACLTAKGEVFTWGRGEEGQLGHSDTQNGYFPRRVVHGILKKKKVAMMAAGEFTCIAVLEKAGGVVAWGRGSNGELGQPAAPMDSPVPVVIPAFTKRTVRSISAGRSHCAAVVESLDDSETDVFVWGDGANGKLGLNSTEMVTEPTVIEALQGCRVTAIHCGQEFTAALTARGDVYTFGSNDSGYLGHGHLEDVLQPLSVEALAHVDVVQLSAGHDHMGAITSDGDVYTWGYGSNGRLGHGDEKDQTAPIPVRFFQENGIKVRSVSCGGHHTCCIAEDGDVYAFGWNHYGQLGVGEPLDPTEGGQFTPQLVEAVKGMPVLQVEASAQHTLALFSQ